MTSEDPFRLEECTTATGGPFGAAFLDAAFINFIRQKLGDKADSILTDRVIKDLLTLFEVGTKRNFDEETGEDEEFSLGNAGTDPAISLNNGFLLLSKCALHEYTDLKDRNPRHLQTSLPRDTRFCQRTNLFCRIVGTRHSHQGTHFYDISDQNIFLVGGFGSNGYLRTFLESQLGADITVIQPSQA